MPHPSLIPLTHALDERIPLWPGDPPFATREATSIATHGYRLRSFCMGEHSGTHANAPGAFVDGGADAESIPPVYAPAVMFSIAEEARRNTRCLLTPAHIQRWEHSYGRVPAGCIALLHTGWDDYWRDSARYLAAWPVFSPEAAELLIERGIAGLATDTHGLDPCDADGFPVNKLLAQRELLALECLCNLHRLPPVGAWIMGGSLPLRGGSGAPAALYGLLPSHDLDTKRC